MRASEELYERLVGEDLQGFLAKEPASADALNLVLRIFESKFPYRVRVFNGLCEVIRPQPDGDVIDLLFDEKSSHVVLILNHNAIMRTLTCNKRLCVHCNQYYRHNAEHRCRDKLVSECRECNFVFATVDAMNRHKATDMFDRAQHCPHCNKRFFSENCWKLHTSFKNSKKVEREAFEELLPQYQRLEPVDRCHLVNSVDNKWCCYKNGVWCSCIDHERKKPTYVASASAPTVRRG